MRNRTWFALLAISVAGTAVAGRMHWLNPDFYPETRAVIVREHLAQIPDAIVITGDSLVERNAIAELCGDPIVNAGIGWAKAETLLPLTPLLRGRKVVLAVGVNDQTVGTPLDDFRRDYRELVAGLKPVAVIGIAGDRRNPYDRIIREERGTATFVEGLPASLLPDGLHYSTEGAAEWRRRLEVVCDHAANSPSETSPSERTAEAQRKRE